MSETNMPAAEATGNDELELASYELAFHVLPTVAEGEVTKVFDNLKNLIKKSGGELAEEEAPQRFDLAYDIEKYLEGKNRKFSSTYFGWVRFQIDPANVNELTEGVEGTKELLRYLLVKLTKVEEQNPFLFHESIASGKVQTITDEDLDEDNEEADTENTDNDIGSEEDAESEGVESKEEDAEVAKTGEEDK